MARLYRNSGFAGEMLVAAELSRLGYEVLLGNVGTKRTVGVDLAAEVGHGALVVHLRDAHAVPRLGQRDPGGQHVSPL